jgi:ribose-phosphate pyrophosphokinase
LSGLQIQTRKRMVIAAGHSHPELAQEIADILGSGLADVEIDHFNNGEIYVRFAENIRGADVFVFQTHFDPINDNLMEQLIMIDAAKRASAKRISAVIPYYGYSRQDRKARGREPISARLVADLLTAAGADRVLSVDLHSAQIQGFFNEPFDHITALPLLAEHLQTKFDGDFTVVSPDPGRIKVADHLARRVHVPLAILDKRRRTDARNETETIKAVIGAENVKGHRCVIVDDMIDTAGTVTGGAEVLMEFGAAEVYACATHPILSDPATDRLKNSPIKEVIVTNTVPIPPEHQFDKITVLSIAPIIAKTIRAVFYEDSVSEIFEGEN